MEQNVLVEVVAFWSSKLLEMRDRACVNEVTEKEV